MTHTNIIDPKNTHIYRERGAFPHFARIIVLKAVLALAFVLLCMATAMAQTAVYAKYMNAKGKPAQQYAYHVSSGMEGIGKFFASNNWLVLDKRLEFSNSTSYEGSTTQHLILGDGKQLLIKKNLLFAKASLTIYGQTDGTGKLYVTGKLLSKKLTINGGIVVASNSSAHGFEGDLVLNGGQFTAYGIYGNTTINWRNSTDRIKARSYEGSVTIADGKYAKDADGNVYSGTLTDAQKSAIANVGLQPATEEEFATFLRSHYYTLELPDGVTTTATPAYTYNGTNYYASGTSIDLLSDLPTCWIYTYTVNTTAIDGTSFTISENSTVAFTFTSTPDPAHFSLSGNEYTIHTAEGWDVFCDILENNTKGIFTGKTVKLGADITVSRMAGAQYQDFTGTFDGGGKTLTFNYTADAQYAAPFRYVETGCVIKNLHVKGEINTDKKYAAGLIASQYGTVTVSNCHISVTINSTVEGDGTHGGIVATNQPDAVLNIDGCVFDGEILGEKTHSCGGFVGWKDKSGTVNISNSVFAPSSQINLNIGSETSNKSQTFSRNGATSIRNCYYFSTLNGLQGKAAHTVTAGENVEIYFGIPTEYDVEVSGIKAYTTGIEYGGKFYAGEEDEIPLTLTYKNAPAQTFITPYFVPNIGTIDEDGTLTMPDANVEISGKLMATFDGDNETEISIPDPIDVDKVEFSRTFTADKYSTIVLPFKATLPDALGTFYTFLGVEYDKNGDSKWTANVKSVEGSILSANTPYIFMPNNGVTQFSWNASTTKIKLTTAEDPSTSVTDETYGEWTFTGTYQKKVFGEMSAEQTYYGFAGTDNKDKDIAIGEFVRGGGKAFVRPCRCYLAYNDPNGLSKTATVLPDRIEVRVIGSTTEPTDPQDDPNSGDIETPTSELTPTANVKVWSYAKTIYIAAAPNAPYTIVDINGRPLQTGITATDRDEIHLSGKADGIVIVKIANQSFKIRY